MLTIKVSGDIKMVCPHFVGSAIVCEIDNNEYSETLWQKMDALISDFKTNNSIDSIKGNKVIRATRSAYKSLGKDPNRYRPSAESLCRRIMRDIPLYRINTLVDIINYVSIATGYSIGGFDADKISGTELMLGVGQESEPYESIGRGLLNIEGLPVYRDALGGVGTPTSDNERTKIDLETKHTLIVFNGYSGEEGINEAVKLMDDLLIEFVSARNIQEIRF